MRVTRLGAREARQRACSTGDPEGHAARGLSALLNQLHLKGPIDITFHARVVIDFGTGKELSLDDLLALENSRLWLYAYCYRMYMGTRFVKQNLPASGVRIAISRPQASESD